MKKIFKYRLGRDGEEIVINDKIEKILHVESQAGWPTAWALVDEGKGKTNIKCVGTGWGIDEEDLLGWEYIGTAIDALGCVWHYFSSSWE